MWTPILEGEELVIEVQVPAAQKHLLELELKYVNHDFVGFSEMASGSCNLDVVCGAADGWETVDAYRRHHPIGGCYLSTGGVFVLHRFW
ncbi:MAG: hypothetical protein R2788_23435 [Saprospiraceae bacterium]